MLKKRQGYPEWQQSLNILELSSKRDIKSIVGIKKKLKKVLELFL
jgi:hypothetical protein